MRGLPALAALAGAMLLLPALPFAAAHHYEIIQPGGRMTSPHSCSMAFVFEDQNAKLYISTAAHCIDNDGQTVRMDGVDIGTVAWRDPLPAGLDVALVAIHPALYGSVDPSMRYWGGPAGVSLQSGFLPGSPVYHYGYGIVFNVHDYSRARPGVATLHQGDEYLVESLAVGGDSGSPFMLFNGDALGIVSRYALGEAHTDRGPTVEGVIAKAQLAKGLTLTLQTAPLKDPAQRELERLEHNTGLP